MDDKNYDLVDRPDDLVTGVDAEAATLVPLVAGADGTLVAARTVGDEVSEGEVVGYVQTDEDI